jgi:hypothetical protein
MDKRSYPGFTRADVDKIRRELGKFGIKIPDGDDVEVSGPLGVKMHVKYDEPSQTLDLTILDKPGFISEAQIWKVIESSAGKADRAS